MGEFCFGKSLRKLPKNSGKVLFYETYFEVANINRKPFIWSHYKIITKFGWKKWVSFVLGKVNENCPKINENSYFSKPTSKRIISIGNHLFGPIIG